jgi:hypothetical protein
MGVFAWDMAAMRACRQGAVGHDGVRSMLLCSITWVRVLSV